MENKIRISEKNTNRPIRIKPAIILASITFIAGFILPPIVPELLIYCIIAAILSSLGILIWWLYFSRIALTERLGALILAVAVVYGTKLLIDKSIATANMGMMFPIYAIPVIAVAMVLWAVFTRNQPQGWKRVTLVLTFMAVSGGWMCLRTDGMTGDGLHRLNWRWAETDEERMLEIQSKELSGSQSTAGTEIPGAEWPGFRGPNRDGTVRGLKISTNWKERPPVELWRQPVGPGCSSFSTCGNFFYTQEQRGDYETVSCYSLTDGKPVWRYQDKVRFYDSHAGAGPRSTPTLEGQRVYTLGGTGVLNALRKSDGTVIWTRNAASDAGVTAPPWGFCASPLITGDKVIIALSGKLAAYDTLTGNPQWYGPDGGHSYSSPQMLRINDVPQVVLMSKSGAYSLDPENGNKLWEFPFEADGRVLQPTQTGDNQLLLTCETKGVRLLNVTKDQNGWTAKEKWNSTVFKAYFNDFVIHKGYAYGFDGPNIACLNLTDGKRMWKGNPYRGWLILLADQDLLMVLTEKGDLVLVNASPNQFNEISKIQAIKGKTWNHPAMAGNVLLLRNSREMTALQLPSAD